MLVYFYEFLIVVFENQNRIIMSYMISIYYNYTIKMFILTLNAIYF